MNINSSPDDRNVLLLAINRLTDPNLEEFVLVVKHKEGMGIAHSSSPSGAKELLEEAASKVDLGPKIVEPN